jgi:hypothetical protein
VIKIKYTNPDGSLAIVHPAPDFKGTMEELAAKTVPEGLSWSTVEEADLPISRNYRDAWVENGSVVDIDLEKAKPLQKGHMIRKASDRARDEFGNIDQQVIDEINALDVTSAADLTELYNMWPTSIDNRVEPRPYVIRQTGE